MSRIPRRIIGCLVLIAIGVWASSAMAQKPFDDPILERMRKDLFFLASPECEGRGVDTAGIDKAADYIAAAFQAAGLQPAGPKGTYFQPFKITLSSKLAKENTLILTGPNGQKLEPKFRTDYTPMGYTAAGQVQAPLVFVGYGISAPNLKYDDYDGVDVAGKFVVILRRTPRYGEKGERRFDTTVARDDDSPHAAFATKIELATKKKAAGLIIVNDSTAAGRTDPLPAYELHASGTTPATIPVLFLKRSVVDEILAAAGQKSLKDIEDTINAKLRPVAFPIQGWTADTTVSIERKQVGAKNVVGVLEGSGPLKDETVILGAHYDHVGYGNFGSAGGPSARGKIHYGADDNASGTTGLIEMARRLAAIPNREGRRIVFIAFSGEEIGLLGSLHYCKEPLYPLEKTVAMINMDMIGRTKPVPVDWLGLFGKKDRLVIYGTGTGDYFEELVNNVSRGADFKLFKVRASASNSDNHSFYLRKIPILFFFTGLHPEYHRPTDVPEKIDIPGMKKVVDLVEKILHEVTTRETAPKFTVVRESAPLDPTVPQPEPKRTGPRLGILPDYAYEGAGVRLEGVAPGSIAEKTGLKEGDVIVEIAGKPVPNITAYMEAMGTKRPGETIDVVVERGGKKLTLKAKLE
ncbi:MAG: M28 family peptidase [Gemmataceae bacterium]|nr:M28 family peptidase [Gemmata sp.]MDW8197739.1 M28 family peptidase [Gemmataceae bacterium]